MGNDMDTLVRKLAVAREKLAELEAALQKLDAMITPLNKQLADLQRERRYLTARIDKLSRIIEG
jgi:septal ring factor EnvC (AmiA/AmiB activator)